MLSSFRRLAGTWPARIFFLLLTASFGLWGIGDVVRNIGRDTSAARVGGQRIELGELQEAYHRNLAQLTRQLGNQDPSPELRRTVALQSAEQLVTEAALAAEARRLGLVVPDAALRQAVFDQPAFRDKQGKFDRAQMDATLRNNSLSEQRFLQMLRSQMSDRQMLEAVAAGAALPDALSREVYAFQHEKRIADAVEVTLAAAAAPAPPTDQQLERWWANHPDRYSTPEYRKVKAIVLAPETVAKDVQVTDEDLKGEWEQLKGQLNTPEKRTVQVILTQDEAEAKQLAETWQGGADWASMQALAGKTGAAPVELSDATIGEFPAPELGTAVFATAEGAVAPPVHSALGWHVLKVVKVTPGKAQTFEEARDTLRARAVAEKAADLIYDRADRLQNLLSSGSTLDDLPGDLGIAGVTGTLDQKGLTPQGQPAPIPGPEVLRQALVAAAFQAKPGDPPKLTQAPNAPDGAQSFYAVTVLDITPPKPRPLAEVAEQVRADWTGDAIRHEQETKAAALLTSVKEGKPLAEAAAAAGLPVRRLPAVGRDAPAEGVPQSLVAPLFALKKTGEPTMVETSDGFMVAVLAEIQKPDPAADPVGWSQVREQLGRTIGQDMQEIFAVAVRDRAGPRINRAAVESLAGAADSE
jgi:peptidyl-prolyl cis-trans isomerase D